MKPLTIEWIEKAEDDYVAAHREYRARKQPLYDIACFHAQQCAKKYLKARLFEAGINIAKTHNLRTLLQAALAVEPNWATLQPHLDALTAYAVDFRYPGKSATKINAKDALQDCREVRLIVRQAFGLPV